MSSLETCSHFTSPESHKVEDTWGSLGLSILAHLICIAYCLLMHTWCRSVGDKTANKEEETDDVDGSGARGSEDAADGSLHRLRI